MANKQSRDVPATGGEADYRKRRNEEGGGKKVEAPPDRDQRLGVDEDGQITTGTHGGPSTPQSATPNHPQHGLPQDKT
jgi:hypothetical protein